MKNNVIVKVVFDRRKVATASKPGAVTIEVRYGAKDKRISTGVSVLPHQWDSSRMVVRHPDSASLNLKISNVLNPIKDFVNERIIRKDGFSFEDLNDFLNAGKSSASGMKFPEYVEKKLESRSDIQGVTKRNHKRLLNALNAFKKIRAFDDLNPRKIREFDEWLHTQGYTILVSSTLIFCFVRVGGPFFEGLDGAVVVDMDAGHLSVARCLLDLFVDELVGEVDGCGILLGVAVVNHLYTGPIKSAQTHGARLARAVDRASVELERAELIACFADSVHLCMCRRVVGECHLVNSRGDNLAVPYYHGAERAAAVDVVI